MLSKEVMAWGAIIVGILMALTKFINESIENNILKNYVKKTREMYRDTAEKTVDILKKNLDFPLIVPDGGLYVWINVDIDSTKFVEDTLKKTGVLFVPGWGFGRTGRKAIRLSFGPLVEDIDKIEEGVQRVYEHLKDIIPPSQGVSIEQ